MTASPSPVLPLAMADEHAVVRVVAIRGGTAQALRIIEMGLNVGSEITVRQREAAGLVVTRGETRLALGIGLANRIMVQAL